MWGSDRVHELLPAFRIDEPRLQLNEHNKFESDISDRNNDMDDVDDLFADFGEELIPDEFLDVSLEP
jgi:hypothetical protein